MHPAAQALPALPPKPTRLPSHASPAGAGCGTGLPQLHRHRLLPGGQPARFLEGTEASCWPGNTAYGRGGCRVGPWVGAAPQPIGAGLVPHRSHALVRRVRCRLIRTPRLGPCCRSACAPTRVCCCVGCLRASRVRVGRGREAPRGRLQAGGSAACDHGGSADTTAFALIAVGPCCPADYDKTPIGVGGLAESHSGGGTACLPDSQPSQQEKHSQPCSLGPCMLVVAGHPFFPPERLLAS